MRVFQQDRAPQWDIEVDVVIAGFGFAGGVAAIAAHDHGLQPLILEKMPFPGGVSITSGGGFVVAREPEGAFKYLQRTCLNTTPDPVLRRFAEGMVRVPDYLRYLETRSDMRLQDVHDDEFPNSDAVYPFEGRESLLAMKIARDDVIKVDAFPWVKGLRGGSRLFKMVYDNVNAREVDVRYHTPVVDLIQAPSGDIIGVVAEDRSQAGATRTLQILARRGVILATGGFEFAEDMKLQYFHSQPVHGITATGNTGDGIRLAQSVGADLWHMWHFHGGYGFKFPDYPVAFRHRIAGPRVHTKQMPWILLDKYGRRYFNEYQPAVQDTSARFMMQYDADRTDYPRIPSFMLLDEEGRKWGPLGLPVIQGYEHRYEWSEDNLAEVERGWIHRANTVAELAEQVQVPLATLQATIDRWNADCRAGTDTEFGRPGGTMMPLQTPPFYWIHAWPVVNNTQGGPVHNEHQQIMKVTGEPIQRLYAAGENGSIFGHLYLESGNITECFVGALHAAEHLATQSPLDMAAAFLPPRG